MTFSVGIVGAGITGRMAALEALQRGWHVTLFDRGGADGAAACSYAAPAMLAPYCELDVTERAVSEAGIAALSLWPEIIREFALDVFFQAEGSLVVAYPSDRAELDRFARGVKLRSEGEMFRAVQNDELRALEPDLDARLQRGLYFPSEGQIDSRGALQAIVRALQHRGAALKFNAEVSAITANSIAADETYHFDRVIDCRGWGAAGDIKDLRAVRGEIIRVYAPDVGLNRPVRLLHPRWPIYIVPHPMHEYVIGATMIESEDSGPITLRSAAEMLNAAFAVSAGFSEARILEMRTGLRPAFPDNEPRVWNDSGIIRANGMYRHGFLLAPLIARQVCDLAQSRTLEAA